ncbi:MAG: hypothetical protein HYR63_22340 [Proteobacteria bacterium]|nr:hypothetical protein [Pseudomonadota bacterium]MBI3497588.1 hypothetical protein [Pseudomonadota bacterium]
MARILVTVVLPLLLPTMAYFGWFYMALRRAQLAGQPEKAPRLGDVPWTVLALTGVMIAALGLFALAVFGGAKPGAHYTPPRIIDGRVVPAETN